MTTKELVWAIRQEQPKMNQLAIAKLTGVSFQRVQQLLKKLGLPTNHWKPRLCRVCQAPRPIDKVFCSAKCKTQYQDTRYNTTRTCIQCGKEFRVNKKIFESELRKGHKMQGSWCVRSCQSRWMGLRNKRKPNPRES